MYMDQADYFRDDKGPADQPLLKHNSYGITDKGYSAEVKILLFHNFYFFFDLMVQDGSR